jgi:hypothetical protein
MTSTYCGRFPWKTRVGAKAWLVDAMARHQVRDRVGRGSRLARTLSKSEVGSLLFFLALIVVTFVI